MTVRKTLFVRLGQLNAEILEAAYVLSSLEQQILIAPSEYWKLFFRSW